VALACILRDELIEPLARARRRGNHRPSTHTHFQLVLKDDFRHAATRTAFLLPTKLRAAARSRRSNPSLAVAMSETHRARRLHLDCVTKQQASILLARAIPSRDAHERAHRRPTTTCDASSAFTFDRTAQGGNARALAASRRMTAAPPLPRSSQAVTGRHGRTSLLWQAVTAQTRPQYPLAWQAALASCALAVLRLPTPACLRLRQPATPRNSFPGCRRLRRLRTSRYQTTLTQASCKRLCMRQPPPWPAHNYVRRLL
jgi:hypothetical protein